MMAPARNLVSLSMRSAARGGLAIRGRGMFFSTSQQFGLDKSATSDNISKVDSVSKLKKSLGHWEPELATPSEEAVKADQAPKEPEAKLQEISKEAAEKAAKTGKSVRDEVWGFD